MVIVDLEWVCWVVEDDGRVVVVDEGRFNLEEGEEADEVALDGWDDVCEGFCCRVASFRSIASIFASVLLFAIRFLYSKSN